jgi:hypothetical protein
MNWVVGPLPCSLFSYQFLLYFDRAARVLVTVCTRFYARGVQPDWPSIAFNLPFGTFGQRMQSIVMHGARTIHPDVAVDRATGNALNGLTCR